MVIDQCGGADHGDVVDFGDFDVQSVDHPFDREVVEAVFQGINCAENPFEILALTKLFIKFVIQTFIFRYHK